MHQTTKHQQEQIKVINKIEDQFEKGQLNLSAVDPVEDFDKDPRICLTSVHFPSEELIRKVRHTLIDPLKKISPDHYYYRNSSLHLTIKNIRVINDPPHFSNTDVERAKQVFGEVIPKYHQFKVYFYRLMLFPANLALMGTTDPELDNIVLELDQKLRQAGVPDDKKYANSKHFFSNMTLARFSFSITDEFRQKVEELSNNISFDPYNIDSVTLITANASLFSCKRVKTWKLG